MKIQNDLEASFQHFALGLNALENTSKLDLLLLGERNKILMYEIFILSGLKLSYYAIFFRNNLYTLRVQLIKFVISILVYLLYTFGS